MSVKNVNSPYLLALSLVYFVRHFACLKYEFALFYNLNLTKVYINREKSVIH
jgi:hypothetical protein